MTAEIVNLRTARKHRAREQKARDAAENRAQHGQSKAEKARIAAERTRDAKRLDGLKRESDDLDNNHR
jgi:Domain of unknown function (DUF4169)